MRWNGRSETWLKTFCILITSQCHGPGVADVGLATGPTRCVSSAAAGRGYVESFHLVFFLFQWSVELEQFRLGSFIYLESMYQWHSDVGLRLKFETLVLAKDKVTHCTVSEWVACVNDCCTEERCGSCPRGTSQSVAKKEEERCRSCPRDPAEPGSSAAASRSVFFSSLSWLRIYYRMWLRWQ